jgi:hypothetical protein
LGEFVQAVPYPRDQAPLEPSSTLALAFAGGSHSYVSKGIPKGELTALAGSLSQAPSVSIHDDRGADICTFAVNEARSTLDVKWKTGTLIRSPELASLTFWLLQTSALELSSPTRKQRLAMKPFEPPPIRLAETDSSISLPVPLPRDAAAAVPENLPDGWKGTWYTDWEGKEAALRKPENASQVLKFEKSSGTSDVKAWFTLSFRPGLQKVESTYARRLAADAAELASQESDLRAVNSQIQNTLTETGLKGNDARLKPVLRQKEEISRTIDAYKTAVAGYKQFTELDVPIELGDRYVLTTLHFRRSEK